MDPLKDPANDRAVKTLKPPPHKPLAKNLMFPDKLKSNLNMEKKISLIGSCLKIIYKKKEEWQRKSYLN